MSNLVEANLAKTTGIVGIAVGICGLGNVICGFIWLGHNGYGGHGLWSGFGVGYFCYYLSGNKVLQSVDTIYIYASFKLLDNGGKSRKQCK